MSVTNLRRAGALDAQLEERLEGIGHGDFRIESANRREWDVLIEDHPYPDQTVVDGTAIYNEPSTYTGGREIQVDFEIRAGSRLFLMEIETDVQSLDSITNGFSQAAGEDLRLFQNLHAPEDALWSFLNQADRVMEITVLDDGTEVPYQEVEGVDPQDVIGEYAIERARVGCRHDGESILVDYNGGSLQIETDWENGREYIIQLFEREVLKQS